MHVQCVFCAFADICFGCSFFTYSWKPPAYNGAFFCLQLCLGAFLLTVEAEAFLLRANASKKPLNRL